MSSFPPKVAQGIVQVMSNVKRLEKDSKNNFGKYAFVGIDAFLEATRPLCADAGLIILQDEVSSEIVESQFTDDRGNTRVKSWLTLKFEFILVHASGEIWERRLTRSVTVDAALGAQAYGAAQSYALKQFLRAIFQMATGDNVDADNHEQTTLPSISTKLANRQEKSTEGFNASNKLETGDTGELPSTADVLGWAGLFEASVDMYTSAAELARQWSAPDTMRAFNELKKIDVERARTLHSVVSAKTKELKNGKS